ncbi:MAG: calcium-translocating P-type ATPase, PMCA-type [Kiritimatiellia bacterium]
MHLFFATSAEDVLTALESNSTVGLTEAQVAASRGRYGANELSRPPSISMMRRIMDALREPMLLLLLLAGVITLTVNLVRLFSGHETDFVECVGIFVAILLSIGISVIMEGRSAKAFDALRKMGNDVRVKILRNGDVLHLPQNELVVGDIVYVGTGDKIVADGRLLESNELMADESALTGESVPVQKNAFAQLPSETAVAERVTMLYAGSYLTGGTGRMVITGVGMGTEFGKIAQELTGHAETATPLQEKMAVLGKRITVLGVIVAGVVFLVQLVSAFAKNNVSFETISEAFISSIVLIVASVPEGLPTIVAVSLAVNIIKMSKQNALVKKLIACETIGCVNVICSDKTGTLTENRMTVTALITTDGSHTPKGFLLNNFCSNTTADLRATENACSFIGNPTECALLMVARTAGHDYSWHRDHLHVLHVWPFSSNTKNMTTIAREDTTVCIYTKGSPEKILACCDLTESELKTISSAMETWQEKACRVIAFAHKVCEENPLPSRVEAESHMVYDGFVAITDPLRAEVYEAVKQCRSAGIELKMLTGDNLITATAIANELHLLDEGHRAVEARELEALDDAAFAAILPSVRVIARSTPTVKLRVVNTLKKLGNVVAVTGDGINDAPAIKHADVGIAMGITGTEVSKEASDILLLDDSFSTIIRAIQWGRGIYENFQRFILFQLTVNLSSVVVVLASILMGFPMPFTALELLWINLVMDGPPALTLGLEPIRKSLLDRPPTPRNASIVTPSMLIRILMIGIYISVIILAQHIWNFLGATTDAEERSVLFTLFVLFQLFNAFNARELGTSPLVRNFFANPIMLAAFGATFILQWAITQYGGSVFGTIALSPTMWVKILLLAVTVLPVSELGRFAILHGYNRKDVSK